LLGEVTGRGARITPVRLGALCFVLAGCLLLTACGAEVQAPSSADSIARQLAENPAPGSTTAAPVAPGRPTTTPPQAKAAHPSVLSQGKTEGRKVVAVAVQMTAVPGQPSGVDQDVLDTLRIDKVRSTVFMAALWAQAHPDVASAIGKDALLEVGNGGYSAEYLAKLPAAVITERTRRAQQVIHAATGAVPKVYRDAQTGYTPKSVAAIAKAGVRPVSGDIDLTNPKPKLTAQQIAAQALARVHSGSIIVIRGDTKDPRVVRALIFLLGGLKRAGYEDVTVSQLMGFDQTPKGK
jgi:peptidoglycan/xylan/chitin deacetylase (PgdA/CDA1 family)